MRHRLTTFATLLLLALGLAAHAFEEAPIPDEIVRLRVESAELTEGGTGLRVVIAAQVADGWHVNSAVPSDETLIPTTLAIEPPEGWSAGEIEMPPGVERVFSFAGGRPLSVYEGTVRFAAPLRAPASVDGDVEFLARLRYQPCDDTRCLRPTTAERRFVVRSEGGAFASPLPAAADTEAAPSIERWLEDLGLLPTLALIALMGLGLNLTPCVYPLISVTIAYFGRQSDDRRSRTLGLALVYAFGITVTFSALGVAAALSGGFFGAALQRPPTLIAIALVMTALAASSFGLYTIRPPAALLTRFGGAGAGVAGAFAMGLTMGLVAAPCVGPIVVALLVTVAQRGDALFGSLLFFALSIGLGAPYVVLGALAGRIHRLPRSGDWQIWVEHLFGFALLGLALYFVSPLLSGSVVRIAAATLLVVAAAVLGFFDRAGWGWRPIVAIRGLVAFAALGAAVWTLLPRAEGEAIDWVDFTEARLAEARSSGRPAVVDFRADWCLPCIEMERTTFVDPDVVARTDGVVMFRADVTEVTPEAESALSRHQVLGVPTTLFFDREGREVRRRVGYVGAGDFARLLDGTRGEIAQEPEPVS